MSNADRGRYGNYSCQCGATFATAGGVDRHSKPYPKEHEQRGQSRCRPPAEYLVSQRPIQTWDADSESWRHYK